MIKKQTTRCLSRCGKGDPDRNQFFVWILYNQFKYINSNCEKGLSLYNNNRYIYFSKAFSSTATYFLIYYSCLFRFYSCLVILVADFADMTPSQPLYNIISSVRHTTFHQIAFLPSGWQQANAVWPMSYILLILRLCKINWPQQNLVYAHLIWGDI